MSEKQVVELEQREGNEPEQKQVQEIEPEQKQEVELELIHMKSIHYHTPQKMNARNDTDHKDRTCKTVFFFFVFDVEHALSDTSNYNLFPYTGHHNNNFTHIYKCMQNARENHLVPRLCGSRLLCQLALALLLTQQLSSHRSCMLLGHPLCE